MSSDEDEVDSKPKSSTSKHSVSSDLVKKFEELKQKRARIQRRRLKRTKKEVGGNKSAEKETVSNSTVTIPEGIYLQPNDEEKQELDKLQKEIDVAISKGDFERAETLNDQLFEKEETIMAGKIDAAVKTDSQLKQKQQDKAEKKSPFWRFDPKKRWETKSNM